MMVEGNMPKALPGGDAVKKKRKGKTAPMPAAETASAPVTSSGGGAAFPTSAPAFCGPTGGKAFG